MRGGELMRWPGLRGVILGKEVETTVSNKEQPCPLDGQTGNSMPFDPS